MSLKSVRMFFADKWRISRVFVHATRMKNVPREALFNRHSEFIPTDKTNKNMPCVR